MKDIINEINNIKSFQDILLNNPGIVIIKFGAEWCGPCKIIEQDVYRYFEMVPDNIQPIILDVDNSFEVYAFLKNKKMIGGIPAIVAYYKGNNTYVPDDSIVGADKIQLSLFFQRCVNKAKTI